MTGDSLRRVLLGGAVASGAAVLAVAAACGDPYAADAPPVAMEDAAVETSVPDVAVTPATDPCAHKRPPAPPLVDDAPGEELPPFFMAIRLVDLGTAAKTGAGFDLDNVCTCETDPATAHEGGASCTAPTAHCDLAGGVDNTVSALAAQFQPFLALDAIPNRTIAMGRRTLLLQIGKYNGRANDKEVAIGVALSDGLREQGCPGSVEDTERHIWSAAWCGDEAWSFLPDAVIPNTKQPLTQGLGYVSNGVLSFQLAGTLFLPFTEDTNLRMGSPLLSGTLVPLGEDLAPRDPGRPPTEKEKRLFSLEKATLGGRIRAPDLLSALGTISNPPKGDAGVTYLCEEPAFDLARVTVCDSLDITASQALDFDPGAKCDSLSAAVSFTAFPVLPGEVHMPEIRENPCAPGPNGQPPDSGTSFPYRCTQP